MIPEKIKTRLTIAGGAIMVLAAFLTPGTEFSRSVLGWLPICAVVAGIVYLADRARERREARKTRAGGSE